MKCGFLIEAIGNIDSGIVDEAENYRPKQKKRAWIWAASAACLCLAVVMIFSRTSIVDNMDEQVNGYFAGIAVNGYIDYREIAEKGKVTITDELKALMDEHSEPFDMFKENPSTVFYVHITDADGAEREKIYVACLRPLGLREEEYKRFLNSGLVTLSKKQIYAVESSPELALIIAPAALVINEEYTKTVGRDTLDVWVFLNDGLDEVRKGCTDDEQWKEIEESVSEFFGKYTEDYGIKREDIIDYRERTGTFHAELDTELVARLLADERTNSIWTVTE